jgi:two-component system, cell cycle sensor histidine kinase and response regulator CckA
VPAIQNMMSDLQGLAGPGIRVVSDLQASHSVAMAGDRRQLQQVITNLVLNARDAMPRGGTITIGVEEQGPRTDGGQESVIISVADTGSGIAQEMLSLIFEPLFTTKRNGGTGLGLAIVTQIVEKHGGTIQVESEEGRGTTFRIGIPLANRAEIVETVAAPRRAGALGRVLIVDDEPMITEGLSAVLELEGIATDVAALGRDVEPAVERFRPEAVLLDLNLPDISGADVYRILMSRWPDLPVIISSGHADEAVVRELMSGAHSAFLLKPYDVETLMETLATVTEPRPSGG